LTAPNTIVSKMFSGLFWNWLTLFIFLVVVNSSRIHLHNISTLTFNKLWIISSRNVKSSGLNISPVFRFYDVSKFPLSNLFMTRRAARFHKFKDSTILVDFTHMIFGPFL
jgi:hypothetical protein